MNMIKNLQLITCEEFNAMEKNEDTYYELVDGEILLVGLNCDKSSKKHQCRIETYQK